MDEDDSLEAQLDAALRDLEEGGDGEAGGTSPAKAPEELDFGGGAVDDDGFEEERRKDRERAQQLRTQEASRRTAAPSSGTPLGDRLLRAKRDSGDTSNDAAVHRVATVCRVIRWGAAATLVALVLLHPRGAGVAEYFQSSEATSCGGVTPMGAAAEMSSKLSQASGHVWTDSKATQADQAVVFRGFQASKAQVDRVLGLAAALKEVKGASLDVWVSLDNTHAHNATHMFITEIKGFKPRLLLGRDLKLHQYTEKDVFRMYPAVAPPPEAGSKQKKKHNRRRPVPRDPNSRAAIESTLIWYNHPKVYGPGYNAVWVVDLDAAYAGGRLADFFTSYTEDDSDLLLPFCSRASPSGPSKEEAEPTALEKYALQLFSPSPTFIHRFSNRLLVELGDCSSRGIVGPENVAVCSLATRAGLVVRELLPEHVGEIKEDGNKPVLAAKDLKDQGGKWFHPVA